MPITTSLDEKTGLRTYEVTEKMTAADFREATDKIFNDPDYRPASNALWDLREARGGTFSVREIRGIVSAVSEHRTEETDSRVALAAGTSRAFDLARMYEQMMTTPPVKVMVFRDGDEAGIWAKGGEE